MVYRLKPLELSFDFEDRVYELGDRINIRVTLNANRDVDVREARADLVCEEIYSRKESGIVVGGGGVGAIQGGKLTATTDYVAASSWTSKKTESDVHSSVVFLEDTTLDSDGSGTYDAILPIQPCRQRISKKPTSFRGTRAAHGPSNGGSCCRSTLPGAATQRDSAR